MLEECDSFRTVFCIDLGLSSGYYIKYYQPGGLNNRHLFLTVLEAGKSKIKVLADLESDHDPDRKSTRLNSSHSGQSRMPSSA